MNLLNVIGVGLQIGIGNDVTEVTTGYNLSESVGSIINIVIGSLGVIAVIVIIIGGVLYMTSSGDSGKVKKAKDTILYGVIGLIICVLAAAIVNFVIANIGGDDGGQQGGERRLEMGECVASYGRDGIVSETVNYGLLTRGDCIYGHRSHNNLLRIDWNSEQIFP